MLITDYSPHSIFSIYIGNQRASISLASLAITFLGISDLFLRRNQFSDPSNRRQFQQRTLLMIIRVIGISLLLYSIVFAFKTNTDFHLFLNNLHEPPYKESLKEDPNYFQQVTSWYSYIYMNYFFIGVIITVFILLVINIWIPV